MTKDPTDTQPQPDGHKVFMLHSECHLNVLWELFCRVSSKFFILQIPEDYS